MNKFYQGITYAALGLASMAYTPSADAGVVGKLLKNTCSTIGHVFIAPVKAVDTLIKERGDIAKAIRVPIIDIAESAGRTILYRDTLEPTQQGKGNTYIEEHPTLEAFVDIGFGAGTGAIIGNAIGASTRHTWQAAGYSAAGETVIKALQGVGNK